MADAAIDVNKVYMYPVDSVFGFPEAKGMKTVGYHPKLKHNHFYVPKVDQNHVFPKDFVREMGSYLNIPDGDGFCVFGPTGSGKTSGVLQIAARLNWVVQTMTCSARTEKSDMTGHFQLRRNKPGEQPSMDFVDGPLTTAMRHGHIFLLNEFDQCDPSELVALNDVIEGRPLILAENGGEVVHPHPMFRLIITGNTAGEGNTLGLYQGVMQQNIAFMDRFRFSKLDYMEPEVEKVILMKTVGVLPEELIDGMIKVANMVRDVFKGESLEAGNVQSGSSISFPISTRVLCRWAKQTLLFSKAPNALDYALTHSLLAGKDPGEAMAVRQLAKSVFGDQWDNK